MEPCGVVGRARTTGANREGDGCALPARAQGIGPLGRRIRGAPPKHPQLSCRVGASPPLDYNPIMRSEYRDAAPLVTIVCRRVIAGARTPASALRSVARSGAAPTAAPGGRTPGGSTAPGRPVGASLAPGPSRLIRRTAVRCRTARRMRALAAAADDRAPRAPPGDLRRGPTHGRVKL